MDKSILLTIAIPTYNRASFLSMTLEAVQTQRAALAVDCVEVLVLDNHSTDATPGVVARCSRAELPIRCIRREANIGSDRNIADAFDQAHGRYVWILSDDDFPTSGTVQWIVNALVEHAPALLYLRPFGYETNATSEDPGGVDRVALTKDSASFMAQVGAHITFISAIIVDKSLIPTVRAEAFVGSNLVQVEIYLRAAVAGARFLTTRSYRVACKRNNSGGYDFSEVFVERLGAILDRYVGLGLPLAAAKELERSMLLRYYPQHAWIARRKRADVGPALARFRSRFGARTLYWITVDPILAWPRWAALAYGAMITVWGRALTGDLRRGIMFAKERLKPTKKESP